MAYHQEGSELVIDGFEKGIADNPFAGLSDIRNANLISTPGECAVNFSTSKISYPIITNATVTNTSASADTVDISGGPTLEGGMAVTFSVRSSAWGITLNTVYWVKDIVAGTTFKLYTDRNLSSLVDITADGGTGTFSTVNMGSLTYAATNTLNPSTIYNYAVDANGRVWGNDVTTLTNQYWTYTGNTTLSNANGNGLVWYQASNGAYAIGLGWLFVFRNGCIDYAPTANLNSTSWVYGWKPSDGSTGNTATVMNTPLGTNNPHAALVGQDNAVYFTDANFLGSFFEITAKAFTPTDTTTYSYAKQALQLPFSEIAQCLSELGTNLLTGGRRNLIYPWNRVATSFSFPIFLPEINVQKMVTVNTNTFIFMGTRGRIYVTNGTNAQLYAKIPDHISGTVDPIFTWGAAGYHKNQLYFGVSVTNSAGTASTKYGGLWAIDMDTNNLRGVNQLSYNSGGTFAGYATVFIQIPGTNALQGTGFYVGWDSGSSTYGMDITSATPYTNYDTYVESDMVPVGTFLNKKTFEIFEWKLSRPLVSGESIRLKMRNDLTTAFTTIGTTGTESVGLMSGVFPATPQEQNQYLQLRAELSSTASSPSYVHLTQIRARAQTSQVIGTAAPL